MIKKNVQNAYVENAETNVMIAVTCVILMGMLVQLLLVKKILSFYASNSKKGDRQMKYYKLVNQDGKTTQFFKAENEIDLVEISKIEFDKLKHEMDDRHAVLIKKAMNK